MPKKTDQTTNYQELSQQLDDVMTRLQQPDVGIDEAVQYYEQALGLIKKLETHLQTAENKIQAIKAALPGEAGTKK